MSSKKKGMLGLCAGMIRTTSLETQLRSGDKAALFDLQLTVADRKFLAELKIG